MTTGDKLDKVFSPKSEAELHIETIRKNLGESCPNCKVMLVGLEELSRIIDQATRALKGTK